MRIPDHLLKAIVEELRLRPSEIGVPLMAHYQVELRKFEAHMKQEEPDYMPALMNRIAEYGKDLREWYERLIEEREAMARKKKR